MMIDRYRDDGFVHVRGVLDPNRVARWRSPLIEDAAQLPNAAKDGETAAIFPLDRVDAAVAGILHSAELGRIAAAALECAAIRLVSAAAYIKPPGAAATFWHQDLWFFPIVDAPMTTLWVPLTPVDRASAPMVYAGGSQRGGCAAWTDGAPPSDWPLHAVSPMATGDVVAHDGWVLHGSYANGGSRPREAIGLSYVPADTRFATRAELQREPGRWAWLEPYLEHGSYREGLPIAGPECPMIDLS